MPAFPQSGTHCFRRNVHSPRFAPPSLCTAAAPDITRIMNACVRTWVRARREKGKQARRTSWGGGGKKEGGKGEAFAYPVVVEFAWRDSKAGSRSRTERGSPLASTSKLPSYPLFHPYDLSSLRHLSLCPLLSNAPLSSLPPPHAPASDRDSPVYLHPARRRYIRYLRLAAWLSRNLP